MGPLQNYATQWHPTPVLLPGESPGRRSLVGCCLWGREESDTTEQLHFHFHFHALEKEMVTHSSVLAWRIPGTGEPDGLLSLESHRVRHDCSDLASAAATLSCGLASEGCLDHRGTKRSHSEAGGEEVGHGVWLPACWTAQLFGRCRAALSLDQSLPSPTLPQRLCSCFFSPG